MFIVVICGYLKSRPATPSGSMIFSLSHVIRFCPLTNSRAEAIGSLLKRALVKEYPISTFFNLMYEASFWLSVEL